MQIQKSQKRKYIGLPDTESVVDEQLKLFLDRLRKRVETLEDNAETQTQPQLIINNTTITQPEEEEVEEISTSNETGDDGENNKITVLNTSKYTLNAFRPLKIVGMNEEIFQSEGREVFNANEAIDDTIAWAVPYEDIKAGEYGTAVASGYALVRISGTPPQTGLMMAGIRNGEIEISSGGTIPVIKIHDIENDGKQLATVLIARKEEITINNGYNGYFKLIDISKTDENGNTIFRIAVADGESWDSIKLNSAGMGFIVFGGRRGIVDDVTSTFHDRIPCFISEALVVPPNPGHSSFKVAYYVWVRIDAMRGFFSNAPEDDHMSVADIMITDYECPEDSRRFFNIPIGRVAFGWRGTANERTVEMRVYQDYTEGTIKVGNQEYYVGAFSVFPLSGGRLWIPGGRDIRVKAGSVSFSKTLNPAEINVEEPGGFDVYMAIDMLRQLHPNALTDTGEVLTIRVGKRIPNNTKRWHYVALATGGAVAGEQTVEISHVNQSTPDNLDGSNHMILSWPDFYDRKFALFDKTDGVVWCAGGETDLPGRVTVPAQDVAITSGYVYLLAQWDGNAYSAAISTDQSDLSGPNTGYLRIGEFYRSLDGFVVINEEIDSLFFSRKYFL